MRGRALVAAVLLTGGCSRLRGPDGEATACARHGDCPQGLCVARVCTPVAEAITGRVLGVGPEEAFETVGDALAEAEGGDAVLVRGGIWREALRPQRGDVLIAGWPGEEVVFAGTLPLDAFAREGEGWRCPWTTPVAGQESFFVDGLPLEGAASMEGLAPGTFWIEGPAEAPLAVHLRLPDDGDPRGHEVEGAALPELFAPAEGCRSSGSWRLVRLAFRGAASARDGAAVCLGGSGSRLEEVEIAWASGRGLDVSGGAHVIRDVRLVGNGGSGIVATGEATLLERVEVSGNGWRDPRAPGAVLERAVVVGAVFVGNPHGGLLALDAALVHVTVSGNGGVALAMQGGSLRDSVVVGEGALVEAAGAVDLDGNVFWSPAPSPFWFDGRAHPDLVAWQAASGDDAGSVFADPLLAADGWHLREGSPASGRSQGTALSSGRDLDGDARPGPGGDAGADQRVSTGAERK